MKTIKSFFKFILAALAVVTFFSCDVPVALGTKLDIYGPTVTITSPTQRKIVTDNFEIIGTADDATGIGIFEVKAVINNVEFPKKWRYTKGAWEIYDFSNGVWSWQPFADAQWVGTPKSAHWKVNVNMLIGVVKPDEGEYTFSAQAWDTADFTSDSSYKAVVVIVDAKAPKADVTKPFIYRDDRTTNPTTSALNVEPLKSLDAIPDGGTSTANPKEYEDPAYLGKFVTQEFELKWQVEDSNDVYSFELFFYDKSVNIDSDTDNYIYRYNRNIGPPPANVNFWEYIKPNGTITVPDLKGPDTNDVYDGELKTKITTKTTVKVVAVCYDAAGIRNDEAVLGYFVFWPRANNPWITFPEGMGTPPAANQAITDTFESSTFTVYPSKNIKATAYQAYGVKEVKYRVTKREITGDAPGNKGTLTTNETIIVSEKSIQNKEYAPNMYSTIFPWDFQVPNEAGYYVVYATAYSNKGKPSSEYKMIFRVNDITFPDFPIPISPAASSPLFLAMNSTGTSFTLSGMVDDATQVYSVCLVWINPQSKGFAAQSQLRYFRESNYSGWEQARLLTAGGAWVDENIVQGNVDQDPQHRNKVCKILLNNPITDPDTKRKQYTFSKVINLADLNIGVTNQPLRSQMFLLRAENSSGKCTIITYAPQGDTSTPTIAINDVVVSQNPSTPLAPNVFTVLPQFVDNGTITINGTWREDSVKLSTNLNLDTFFKNFFEIKISGVDMNNSNLTVTRSTALPGWDGTWRFVATVKENAATGQVPLKNLKDTLVIDVTTKDIGGNIAQIGSSWLIKSDDLKLLRISSKEEDDVYSTGKTIDIFLEFSKPVNLSSNFTGDSSKIELILSSASGNTARAVYQPSGDMNSQQVFRYTVKAGDTAKSPNYLNVTGLYYNGAALTTSSSYTGSYPFTWSRGSGDEFEEVRITMVPNKAGTALEGTAPNRYFVRTLPTSTSTTNTDYQYTLFASKHIEIDTTAPTITAVSTTSPAGYYNKESDIYFSLTFSEPVKLASGTGIPRIPLELKGTPTTTLSTETRDDIKVNGNTISFKYHVGNTDSTRGSVLSLGTGNINGNSNITDIAGNAVAINALASLSNRALTGIYIETETPGTPTVRLFKTSNATVNDANVISQAVGTTTNSGLSTATNRNLGNVYNDLYLAIQANTTGDATPSYKSDIIEYSFDNGTTWLRAPTNPNTPFAIEKTGSNTIIARQTDKAGNISDKSPAITYTLDKGDLLTRISSTNANGVYTHVDGRNQITLTMNFRKNIYFSGTPQIEINVKNGTSTNNRYIAASTTNASTNVLNFVINVNDGDATPTNPTRNLDIVSFSNITAFDGGANNTGVNVSDLIRTQVTAMPTPKLDSTKEFTIETGKLTYTAPTFAADSGTEGNDNFHGISSDGSYWTTLQVVFNHTIYKNAGNITITQIAGSGGTAYRLPAVLTESQYNRFRSITDFDKYYIKGTNGYNNTTGASDTTTKYILQYNFNPDSVITTNNSGFTGDTIIPTSFFNDFRAAEAISVNVNSQAVTIGTDGKTLNIRLTGSNAPQVPGATYAVVLPAALVTDSLGNSSSDSQGNTNTSTSFNVALRGVAKPFVRVRKSQDTIATQTGSNTAPKLVATQPMQSYARMDCRTPGATITYTSTEYKNHNNTNVTEMNWGTGVNQTTANNDSNGATTAGNYNGPQDTADGATRPGATFATAYPATTGNDRYQITLGNNPAINSTDVQGYQWWVRARASVGGVNSSEAEEKAYRTVITLQVRNYYNNYRDLQSNENEAILGAGDQIWIRGGDAIGSSSIPGFPFTWEDNWNTTNADDWKDKRAGIRLMTKTNNTDSLNNSEWKFVTWEINTTAYVDFIMGHDANSSVGQAWQYGPEQSAYARSGWTSFKDKYPIYPGKHRWCDMGKNWSGKYGMNFSKTFHNRPTNAPFNTTNYTRWPGVNTK